MPKNHPDLTAARLRELLSYDPETGVFLRLSSSGNAKAGDVAGNDDGHGYRQISIAGTRYKAHRLAWLYVHGSWPTDQLDHESGVRSENRIKNLRDATNAQNQQNAGVRRDNASGHTGVYWHKRRRKWMAQIKVDGHLKHIGYFDQIGEAVAARATAKAELHKFQPVAKTVAGFPSRPRSPM